MKDWRTKAIVFAIAFTTILSVYLAACAEDIDPSMNQESELPVPSAGSEESLTIEASEPLADVESLPIAVEYEYLDRTRGVRYLKSGKLIYTITDICLVNNIAEIPNAEEGFSDAIAAFVGEEYKNGALDLPYPDFVLEDGSFIPGAYLLVLDITVTSENAVNYTVHDLDEDGYPKGRYEDPYIFRADGIFFLEDSSEVSTYAEEEGKLFIDRSWGIDYFSERNKRPESHMAFRLMPAEELSYKVGFMVTDARQGGYMNFDTLYLSQCAGSVEDIITRLDLTLPN